MQEDECAPDSTEWFDKAMKIKYGFTINDFTNNGEKTSTDNEVSYVLKGYKLSMYPGEQYWHLSRI